MIKSFIKKKFTLLILLNIFFLTPLIYYRITSDTYIFIKDTFIALNLILLIFFNSIFNENFFNKKHLKSPISLPFLIFVASSFFSVFNVISLYDYSIIILNIVLFYILYSSITSLSSSSNIIKIIIALAISCLFAASFGIIQYLNIGTKGPFDFKPAKDYYNLAMHPSTFGHDNFAGEFFAAAFPFIIILTILSLMKRRLFHSGFAIMTLPIVLSYFVITQSRSAWIGFLSSLTIMLPMLLSKFNLKEMMRFMVTTFLILTFVIAILLPLFFNEIYNYKSKFLSIFNMEDNPIKFRLFVWKSSLVMIKNYFPFGVGVGNFKQYYPLFRNPEEIKTSGPNIMVRKIHNEYLQIAAEFGPIGIFSFIWLIMVSYKSIFYLIKKLSLKNHLFECLIIIGATGSLTANLVQAMFGFSLQNPASSMLFFFSLGFISSFLMKRAS